MGCVRGHLAYLWFATHSMVLYTTIPQTISESSKVFSMQIISYHIYSNRSRTPNSSHPRIVATHSYGQTWLSGCGHNRKCNALPRSRQNHSRRQPWIGSYAEYLMCSLRKPVFCAKKFVDYTAKYRSEINKGRTRLVTAPKQGQS